MKLALAKPIWWAASALGVIAYVKLWPVQYRIPCLFHLATGLYCPGCGTTRALTALTAGDLNAAFNYNQLIFFIPLFLLVYQFSKRSQHERYINTLLFVVGGVVALTFTIWRNIVR